MLPKINPTHTSAWQKLKAHQKKMSALHIYDLYKADPERFKKMSITFEDILFDYSKNLITDETLDLLIELAEECKLSEATQAMFSGKNINETEDRAVLHTALRSFSNEAIYVNGKNITPQVQSERVRMEELCKQIHEKIWLGCTGKPIRYIVNIGIGGSDLGPSMVTEALRPYWKADIHPYFISNVDGSNLTEVLKLIDFEETLFIIASKTFTTQETMTNANSVRRLFIEQVKNEDFVKQHFIAVTGDKEKANAFGIANENIFEIWDWVCGRFSLWGSVGISIALTVGYNHFENLLKGASAVDTQFKSADFKSNIPVLMGLLSIWYSNFFNTQSEAVLSYDHYLHKFKSYLQQGSMESNGKNIDRNGKPINYQTASVVWGETGTNGQHSFYQFLHQGTSLVPCDFIITLNNKNGLDGHHEILLSNALAQTEALMTGKTIEEIMMDLQGDNKDHISFKTFKGSKPTNSFLIKDLTPYNLGSLIASYEHKIFVQGIIWNVFSFDQWGVELGKELASDKLSALQRNAANKEGGFSMNSLINSVSEWMN